MEATGAHRFSCVLPRTYDAMLIARSLRPRAMAPLRMKAGKSNNMLLADLLRSAMRMALGFSQTATPKWLGTTAIRTRREVLERVP
jgi:hypothetical protein